MPTSIDNETPASSKFKFSGNQTEPRVLTKYDTKPFLQQPTGSILDTSFKSDTSDSSTDEDLRLDTTADLIENSGRFEPKKYDGFQLKVLPTKDKILIRNSFTYLDPKSFSIVWHNIGLFIILHTLGIYGIYLCFFDGRYGPFLASG